MISFNKLLDYLTRGEWNKTIEETLESSFFRQYRLRAISMPDFYCHDIYNSMYIPFVVNKGRGMEGVKHCFNTIEDIFLIKYSVKRMKYLNKHKVVKQKTDKITSYFLFEDGEFMGELYSIIKTERGITTPVCLFNKYK